MQRAYLRRGRNFREVTVLGKDRPTGTGYFVNQEINDEQVWVHEERDGSEYYYGVVPSEMNYYPTETARKIGILWNGGWDDYLVEMSTARESTEEENNAEWQPVVNGWLRGAFSNGKVLLRNQSAKIIEHIDGGD